MSHVFRLGVLALTCAIYVSFAQAQPAVATANAFPAVAVAGFSTHDGLGFWLTYANGAVSADGDARLRGDASQLALNGPMVGGAVTPNGNGYWLVANDGGLFSFGSARFFGSMGAAHLNQPVFSMAPTRSGNGYWLVARDGGIFTFGDGHFYGSTGKLDLSQPIIGITTSPTGKGYRMVARDGGIFSFGDAPFFGSLPSRGLHVADVVGMAPTPSGKGYWIARADGSVYAFGDANPFNGYAPSPCDLVAGIFSSPKQRGYRLLLQSGATIAFFQDAPGGGRETGSPRQCPPWTGTDGSRPPRPTNLFTEIAAGSIQCRATSSTVAQWSLRIDSTGGFAQFVGPIAQKIGTTRVVPTGNATYPRLSVRVDDEGLGTEPPAVVCSFGLEH